MAAEAEFRNLLGTIVEPATQATLSQLKMVSDVSIDGDKVHVKIDLPTPAYAYKDLLTGLIQTAAKTNLAGVKSADVQYTATTKGKQETRSVPVSPELKQLLEGYRSDRPHLFPGRWGRGHICPESADAILRAAFKRLGIEGSSTHSFRRTAITWMHSERVPIKHIQSISGHKSLSALQRYIDVTEKDKEMAIATLSFLHRAAIQRR